MALNLSDARELLYDIPADPWELEYLKAQISARISGCIGQSPTEQPIQLDQEHIRQLKSLGYIR